MAQERYIVALGTEGFCDRLQSLCCAIEYARRTGRTLVVAWQDAVWSHGRDEPPDAPGGFCDYFRLVGIKWAPRLPDDLLECTDVTPAFWVGKLRRCGGQWIYDQRAVATFNWDAPTTARVVVSANIGFRRFRMEDFVAHVRLQPWLVHAWAARAARIQRHLAALPAARGHHCCIVHLRGTDRAKAPVDAAQTRKAFEGLLRRAASAQLPLVVLADDASLQAAWARARPRDMHLRAGSLTARAALPPGQGSHFQAAAALSKAGLSKRDLNREAIVDWITLASGTDAWALQPKSLFFVMARALAAQRRGVATLMSSAH